SGGTAAWAVTAAPVVKAVISTAPPTRRAVFATARPVGRRSSTFLATRRRSMAKNLLSYSRSSPESVRVPVALRWLGAGQRRYWELLTRSFRAREDQGWVCRRWVTMGPFEDRRILKSDRDSVREGHRRSGSSRTVGRGEGGQNDEEHRLHI